MPSLPPTDCGENDSLASSLLQATQPRAAVENYRRLPGEGPVTKPSSLVRFLPVSQYLLELASDVWVLQCGVLSSRGV